MAAGQEMPGVVGKMGVSESAQRITPAPKKRKKKSHEDRERAFHILCGHLGLIKGK